MKSYQNPQTYAVGRKPKNIDKCCNIHEKKKQKSNKQLDRDLKDTFPASDAITKY